MHMNDFYEPIDMKGETTMDRMPQKFTPDQEKMRQLIQYISQRCASQSNFGKTKLCKTLYFADSLCFLHLGYPITGWEYIRMPHGPFPDGIEAEYEEMIDLGMLQMQIVKGDYLYPLHKPVNLQLPNLDVFTSQEISIVNSVIEQLEDMSGSYLSDVTHLGAWKFAKEREKIPYESFHLDTNALTPMEEVLGIEVAKAHGLLT